MLAKFIRRIVSEIIMIVKRGDEHQWMSAGYPDAERAILHLNKLEGRTSIVRMKAGARGPMHTHEGEIGRAHV